MAADLVELRMNVAALKRVDPYIKDILGSATQVALYTFSAVKNEWEKTDIEGALFVYSRNGEPYNSILIMNRLNTNNLVEPVVKDLDWQMQAPFLLYRNGRNSIFGIWFYNRDECVKITYLLETIMESLNNKQEKSKTKEMSVGTDIFSMLSKAQEDFNKTPVKGENQPQQLHASTPKAPDVTSQSVMDFFAKASTTKSKNQAPVCIPSGNNEPLQPLLHRLMSNPAHSVEHIEKQQRAVTPQEQSQNSTVSTIFRNKSIHDKSKNSNEIFKEHSVSPNVHEISTCASSTVPVNASGVNTDRSNQSLLENGLNFMRIASPVKASSPRSFFLQQAIAEDTDLKPASPPLASFLDTPQKPALMPPMMFTSSATKEKQDFSHIKPIEASPDIQLEPLNRKQMIQAFHYLLKNDPEFVTKLHEAYVKSFTEIIS